MSETWEEAFAREKKLTELAKEELLQFTAALTLAGFRVDGHELLVNGYSAWWNGPHLPWYLFKTQVGFIKVGWRKRVINIDWSHCGMAWTRPMDQDITFSDTYMHAWSYEKMVEYCKPLFRALFEHRDYSNALLQEVMDAGGSLNTPDDKLERRIRIHLSGQRYTSKPPETAHGLLFEIHELVKFDLIETPHPEQARLDLMNRIGRFLGLHQ